MTSEDFELLMIKSIKIETRFNPGNRYDTFIYIFNALKDRILTILAYFAAMDIVYDFVILMTARNYL